MKEKITVCVLVHPEGFNPTPKVLFYATLPDSVDADSFRCDVTGFIRTVADSRTTSSRRVYVEAVDETEAAKFYEGPIVPRNGSFASPVEPGQIFASAIEASKHLGFNHHEVGIYLAKARRKFPDDADADQRIARVRGVSLMYESDKLATIRD